MMKMFELKESSKRQEFAQVIRKRYQ